MMKSIKLLFQIATFTSILLLAGQCFAESEVAVISTPGPQAVDVNPLTGLAYVANFLQPTVSVISEQTNTIVDTITFPAGPNNNQAEMVGVAVNPATSRLYASDTHNSVTYVVDTHNNRIIDKIFISGLLTVNPFNNKLYVSLFGNGVEIIDGKTDRVAGTVQVQFPGRAAVDFGTNRVYVPSNNFNGSVVVIDGRNNTALATIATGNFTAAVGVDFQRHLAYAANQGFTPETNNLSVIDTNTNRVIGTIQTDESPSTVSVNPFTNRIYVANRLASNVSGSDVVDIIDGGTGQIVNRLPIDRDPVDSAIDLGHNLLYIVSANLSDVVTAIDTNP
jgi:YVTN family beta-propeller protein